MLLKMGNLTFSLPYLHSTLYPTSEMALQDVSRDQRQVRKKKFRACKLTPHPPPLQSAKLKDLFNRMLLASSHPVEEDIRWFYVSEMAIEARTRHAGIQLQN